MHIGSTMTENVWEADPEYAEVAEQYEEDVLVAGVPKTFTNFSMSGSNPRQAPVYNPYFLAIIKFICALSFGEKYIHHRCSSD